MSNRIIKIFFCVNVCLLSGFACFAQKIDYNQKLNLLNKEVEKQFYQPNINYYKEVTGTEKDHHQVSFLWSLCAILQADNEIEKLIPKRDLMSRTLSIIEKYNDDEPPASGYDSYPASIKKEDRYYDDNQWIGLAAMDAYFRTKKPAYLQLGKKIYTFMMTGFDTTSGGGIYWKEGDKSTKNVCSNGPGILLALKLYQATQKSTYLDTAKLIYQWTNDHLQSPSGLYYDNLHLIDNKISRHQFSYNTGTMLESNVYLYKLTQDSRYLNIAKSIADTALNYFYAKGQFRDDYWFNAVMLRGFQSLYEFDKEKKYLLGFKKCLDYAILHDMNRSGIMGNPDPLNLVAQGGMLEILARFAWLSRKGDL